MNERIQELKGKTLDKHFSHTWSTMDYEDVTKFAEKFAELIVKECIAQARSEEDRFYGLGEDDLALTMEHFQEVLKHHFGVEE